MDAFRVFFADIGMHEVASYIQSGNFVLRGRPQLMDERALEAEMYARLQIRTVAFLRTVEQYRQIVSRCPYSEMAAEHPRKLLVTFFGRPIRADEIASLQEQMADAARLHLAGTELYTYMLPEQEQGSFSNNALEKILQTPATTRNWLTIRNMEQLQRDMP